MVSEYCSSFRFTDHRYASSTRGQYTIKYDIISVYQGNAHFIQKSSDFLTACQGIFHYTQSRFKCEGWIVEKIAWGLCLYIFGGSTNVRKLKNFTKKPRLGGGYAPSGASNFLFSWLKSPNSWIYQRRKIKFCKNICHSSLYAPEVEK